MSTTLFEFWDTVKVLRRKKNKHLAVMLEQLETLLPPEEHEREYKLVRKLILDHFNDYHRAVYRTVLGIEVEGQHYL